jgi:hypothetical protein
LPGNGSLVAVIQTCLGRGPDLVVGKPAPQLFQAAKDRANATNPLIVGDRLDTDIEAANRAGFDSLLVLTGVTSAPALLEAPQSQRPKMVAPTLDALFGPRDAALIPQGASDWRAEINGDVVELSGEGPIGAALATLCAKMWDQPPRPIVAGSASAARALKDLGLT